ncbi:hypothetical protein EYF80_024918 [Liparis tanakae]|uniref:Uncharacterized protein n=1 Tax=Liparis tanakae TaxID=230148 RepID=A0A4Z2HG25_9TELE|nr:hypothetical protein EYF80_024918 [Liparis tanakae]
MEAVRTAAHPQSSADDHTDDESGQQRAQGEGKECVRFARSRDSIRSSSVFHAALQRDAHVPEQLLLPLRRRSGITAGRWLNSL